jgi:hypothetical protein
MISGTMKGVRQAGMPLGDPGFARHPRSLRLPQHIEGAQGSSDLEQHRKKPEHHEAEADKARERRRERNGKEEQRGAAAAEDEIRRGFPVPVLLMYRLYAFAAYCELAAPSTYPFPRFRPLALFERRPPERVDGLSIAGVRKPAQGRILEHNADDVCVAMDPT